MQAPGYDFIFKLDMFAQSFILAIEKFACSLFKVLKEEEKNYHCKKKKSSYFYVMGYLSPILVDTVSERWALRQPEKKKIF